MYDKNGALFIIVLVLGPWTQPKISTYAIDIEEKHTLWIVDPLTAVLGDLEVYLIWFNFYWFNTLAEDDLKTSRNEDKHSICNN